jgi:hypothetical protein
MTEVDYDEPAEVHWISAAGADETHPLVIYRGSLAKCIRAVVEILQPTGGGRMEIVYRGLSIDRDAIQAHYMSAGFPRR